MSRAPALTGPAWPVSCALSAWRWSRLTARVDRPAGDTASPTPSTPSKLLRATRSTQSKRPEQRWSGHARAVAKTADGDVEAIRVLLIAYRSGRDARIKCLNQLRHLGFTAPDELRERFRAVTVASLARDAAALRPNPHGDGVTYATKLAMHTLARRVLDIDADCAHLHGELTRLVRADRTEPPRVARRRRVHRRPTARCRWRQRRTDHLRGGLRPPLRCRPDPRLVRQDLASATGSTSWRQPASQPRPLAHRVHPHGLRSPHPQLRRTPTRRRTLQTRDHAHPQALRRPRGLPPPPAPLTIRIERRVWLPKCQHATEAVLRTICRPAAQPLIGDTAVA